MHDDSVKKVYKEIMKHKVYKRKVKRGNKYVIEDVDAFERGESEA
jgi:hypothetical protein